MKEINIFLAEGLECKDLVRVKNKQILFLDSLHNTEVLQIDNQASQLNLKSGEISLLEVQRNECFDEVHKADVRTEKSEKRKRTWRTFALIEMGVIAVFVIAQL